MKRTYELALVLDPSLSDEEQVGLVDEVKKMVSGKGVEVVKEESWGKRKLAYPVGKVSEGRYVFLYVTAENEAPPVALVEKRLNQNERVLRYLWIRTDEDLRRAMRKGKRSFPAAEAVGITGPLRGGSGGGRERSSVEEAREA
jgi:small subunit ribosomal protein S6